MNAETWCNGKTDFHLIIMSIIDLCEKHNKNIGINIYSQQGGIYLDLRIDSYKHLFYIPGGCLTKENWLKGGSDKELGYFLTTIE